MSAVYLDCNATTPIDPEVMETVRRHMEEEFGNEGSRTHEYGARAKQAVQKARDEVGRVVEAERDEVIFTSGATEANNMALLGLAEAGRKAGKTHIISTMIEHKAVLEPLEELEKRGFEVTLLKPNKEGRVTAEAVARALRPDTWLVSVMHANNETGVVQPIPEIAESLSTHAAWFHIDAAQTFGKLVKELRNPRVNLISASGHKLYAPQGIGALVARRRGYERPPLAPLYFGGGQERGLRPGTLPVALIAGFGEACRIAVKEASPREKKNVAFRKKLLRALDPLQPQINGDQAHVLPHCLSVAFEGIDSETIMVALKGIAALSNGSACTSASYKPSHVLEAMGLNADRIASTIRISWCHLTPDVDWEVFVQKLEALR
jgi:cysteine desulfurase